MSIEKSKQESETKVSDLQKELQKSQQEGKEKIAKQVLDKKEKIVDLLLKTVLSVPLE